MRRQHISLLISLILCMCMYECKREEDQRHGGERCKSPSEVNTAFVSCSRRVASNWVTNPRCLGYKAGRGRSQGINHELSEAFAGTLVVIQLCKTPRPQDDLSVVC